MCADYIGPLPNRPSTACFLQKHFHNRNWIILGFPRGQWAWRSHCGAMKETLIRKSTGKTSHSWQISEGNNRAMRREAKQNKRRKCGALGECLNECFKAWPVRHGCVTPCRSTINRGAVGLPTAAGTCANEWQEEEEWVTRSYGQMSWRME